MRVRTGLDVWEAEQFRALRGLRVGAIVNPTSVDARFRHLADSMPQIVWAARPDGRRQAHLKNAAKQEGRRRFSGAGLAMF